MKTWILAAISLLASSAEAIIIRHDVNDAQYQAALSDFPSLATFYVDGAHGSLIAPQWILTAAHATFCITPGATIKVNRHHAEVKQKWIHPDYSPGKNHDIALVQLTSPVAGIPVAALYEGKEEQGMRLWFIGAGGTGNGKTGQIVDNFENNGVLRKAQNQVSEVTERLLYFLFDEGKNALPLEGVSGGGDSGGPAYFTEDNRPVLVGISSRFQGEAIGLYGIREVYTRVSAHIEWINNVIGATEADRPDFAKTRLHTLPAGLTRDTLGNVCKQIALPKASEDQP
ncbi:S1 family peptidase [Alteromonas sp. H39]|uniref:S1 family peptidase n=1 Tax=Alteromonas sp. H39 TaxID=3389876 RepID=UPI0039DF39BB